MQSSVIQWVENLLYRRTEETYFWAVSFFDRRTEGHIYERWVMINDQWAVSSGLWCCWLGTKWNVGCIVENASHCLTPNQSSCYSTTLNSSFPTLQSGQTQSSGMFSKAVPGSTPLSGSPATGSYSYPQTSHTYFFIKYSFLFCCYTLYIIYMGVWYTSYLFLIANIAIFFQIQA